MEHSAEAEDQQRLAALRHQRDDLQQRIDRLLPRKDDGLTQHFHLGMVGGSGRPVRRLNRRREQSLDTLITRSARAAPLIEMRQRIEREIAFIESGQAAARREREHRERITREQAERAYKEAARALPRIALSQEARAFLTTYPREYQERRPCTVCGGLTTWVLYLDKTTQATAFACWHVAQSSLMPKDDKA